MIHSIVLIVLCALLSVAGNFSLKRAVSAMMLSDGESLLQPANLLRMFKMPMLYVGLGLYALGALLWLQVLSRNALSRAYPMLISLTFVFIAIVSHVGLGEEISLRQVGGMVLILVGIYLLA